MRYVGVGVWWYAPPAPLVREREPERCMVCVLQTGVLSTNHEPSVQRAAAAYTTLCQLVNEKHPNSRALRTAFWVRVVHVGIPTGL